MNRKHAVFFIYFLLACNHTSHKEKLLGNIIAKRDIGPNGIYNGRIDFFDVSTKKKISEEYYDNGIPNGDSKKYYPNGRLLYECAFEHGKINGYANSYDSSGLLENINYFYYDVPIGPATHYRNSQLNRYSFFGFDSQLLFNLDYDSIKKRKITDLQKEFFFYTLRNMITYDGGSSVAEGKVQLFLYKPSPPQYPFKYDLVIINDKYEVAKVVHEFTSKTFWEAIEFKPFGPASKQFFALRLTIKDSINNGLHTMFKYI